MMLAENLAMGHVARAREARKLVDTAIAAPGLVKPEAVADAARDYEKHLDQAAYFMDGPGGG